MALSQFISILAHAIIRGSLSAIFWGGKVKVNCDFGIQSLSLQTHIYNLSSKKQNNPLNN